jgi:N-acetylglucosamine-6-phosphate deacetylase
LTPTAETTPLARTLITNARIFTLAPKPSHWLLIEGTRIADLGDGAPPSIEGALPIDAKGAAMLPGFIDLHVHGACGCDTMDAEPDSLLTMARFFAQHGVTSFLPTTMTMPQTRIVAALRNVAALMGKRTGGAAIVGAHVEGPYINAAMIGAQNPAYVRRASPAETRELFETGAVRRITLAPEYAENRALVADATAAGITTSAGHTQATPVDLREAIGLGLRYTTHTFNAMTPLHHRDVGTVGAALAFDELTCELIADTIHVHPLVIKILIRAKGLDKVVLITDAIAGAGMPDGIYELGEQSVTVAEGVARLTHGGSFAGSVLTLDRGLRNALAAIGDPIPADQDAGWRSWVISSANAARAIEKHTGQIAAGYDADLVLLNAAGDVQMTFVNGECVYSQS